MEFTTQFVKLPVPNFDLLAQKKSVKSEKRHDNLLPNSLRAVFCGLSNCEKTSNLLALLIDPNGLRFENVYDYSKSLN